MTLWATNLNESQGTIETLNGGEYIIATEQFVNTLKQYTILNFQIILERKSKSRNYTKIY